MSDFDSRSPIARRVVRPFVRRSLAWVAGATVALGGAPAGAEDEADEAPAAVAATAVDTFTWDDFIGRVEKDHPLMDAARAGLDSLRAKMSQADWAYFPTAKLTGAATLAPTITGDALASDTDWGHVGLYGDVRLEVVQPIYTFGRIDALQDAAKAGVKVGRAAVEVARWELRARAAEAWYSALLARDLDGMLRDGEVWIDKAETRMETQRDNDSPDYDQLEHLRLKARVAQFYELQTKNRLLGEAGRAGMRALLQASPKDVLPTMTGELEPIAYEPLTNAAYVEIARANDPGLQLARARARASDFLADAKSADLWPNLVVAGEVRATHAPTIQKQRSVYADDPYNRTVGAIVLGLEWKLDIPQRLFAADDARASARRARAEAKVQEQLMEVNVTRLAQDLANQRDLLDVYRSSRRASQGWLSATWDTYESGFGTFRDVMDALVQFYQNRLGYLQVVYNHNLAVFKLSQAIGADVRQLKPDPAAAPAE